METYIISKIYSTHCCCYSVAKSCPSIAMFQLKHGIDTSQTPAWCSVKNAHTFTSNFHDAFIFRLVTWIMSILESVQFFFHPVIFALFPSTDWIDIPSFCQNAKFMLGSRMWQGCALIGTQQIATQFKL